MGKNISHFSQLYKWVQKHDENFVTEVLVCLLRHCLIHDRESALAVVSSLCFGTSGNHTLSINNEITVETQFTHEQGRPDIKIESAQFLAFIEVKKESGLGHRQLARYRVALKKESRNRESKLVLLTRHPEFFADCDELPDHHIRWQNIADLIASLRPKSEVTAYLFLEFVNFLKEQHMALEQVNWQYLQGFQAFLDLLTMIERALEIAGIKNAGSSYGQHWSGYYTPDKYFWIGIAHSRHHVVMLEVQDKTPIDAVAFRNAIQTDGSTDKLRVCLDLNSEDVCFFSKGKDAQLQIIGDFLKKNLESARKCLKQN